MPDEQKPSQTVATEPPVNDVHPEPPAPAQPISPAISMPPNKSSGTAADIPVEPVHIDLSPTPSTSAPAPITGGQPFGAGTPAGTATASAPVTTQSIPSPASKKLVLFISVTVATLVLGSAVTAAALMLDKR